MVMVSEDVYTSNSYCFRHILDCIISIIGIGWGVYGLVFVQTCFDVGQFFWIAAFLEYSEQRNLIQLDTSNFVFLESRPRPDRAHSSCLLLTSCPLLFSSDSPAY